MNERIKQLRINLKMSQKDFGKKIGISNPAISKIERGERNPSEQTLLSICREFNINGEWLRYGNGKMCMEMDKEDEIMAFIGKTFSYGKNNFTKDVIYALSKLNEEQWDLLEEIADLILNKKS